MPQRSDSCSGEGDRAPANQRVRDSLLQLSAFTAHSAIGILIEDDALRIVHLNEAFCESFGAPAPGLLIGEPSSRALQSLMALLAEPAEFAVELQAIRKVGQPTIGDRLRLTDGRVFERDYIPMQLDYGRRGHMWLFRPLGDRQKGVPFADARQGQYRDVVEEQTEFVSRWLPDGTLTFVNDAYCRSSALSRDELLGHSFFTRLPPTELQRLLAHLHQFTPSAPVHSLEHRVIGPDGEVHWQHWTNKAIFGDGGRLIEFQAVGSDTTERRHVEIERIRSLFMLRAVIEASSDGIVLLDNAGDVLTHNQRFLQIWNPPAGWDTDMTSVERRYLFARRTTDAEGFLRRLQDILGRPDVASNDLVTTTEGRLIALSSSPYREGDAIVGRVWHFRDISEEQRRQAVNLSAQKLEALGLLAGGIAHDFNNVLTIILGNISLACQEIEGHSEALARLAVAENACVRARALTQQLLTFSRGGAPSKRTLSLADLLLDVVAFATLGSNVNVESALPADLWPIEADEGQIRQMLLNLLLNAKEAMPAGGVVELLAQNMGGAAPAVVITLRDHGVGIPSDLLPRVFDPYFSTKQSGRGLGLPAAASIARDHGGDILLDSRMGEGTTVTVTLPASQRPVSPAATRPARRTKRALRILFMDDEEYVREIGGRLLSRVGHEVVFAEDGRRAVAAYAEAQQAGRPFDLVIMDLIVPGAMGGLEAAQHILTLDPTAKIVVSSGYANDAGIADYRRYGFCAAVAKPYEMEKLYRVVEECATA